MLHKVKTQTTVALQELQIKTIFSLKAVFLILPSGGRDTVIKAQFWHKGMLHCECTVNRFTV